MFDKIVLGGAQLGMHYGVVKNSAPLTPATSRSLISEAAKYGIKSVDIAFDYGNIFDTINNVNSSLNVLSKLSIFRDECIIQKVNRHADVLNLKTILIHDADEFTGSKQECIKIKNFIQQTKQLKIEWGISIYEHETLLKFLNESFIPNLVQYPFNVLYHSDEIGAECRKNRIKHQVRSVFLQGLLVQNSIYKLPKRFQSNKVLREWYRWLSSNSIDPVQACLKERVLVNKEKVIGFDTIAQLVKLAAFENSDVLTIPQYIKTDDKALLDPRKWLYE
jgi:aryl-alcohol dehydrogenase-like predicted oxidoreductase